MSTRDSADPGVVVGDDGLARPAWAAVDPLLRCYYDTEWGMPVTDEQGVYERRADSRLTFPRLGTSSERDSGGTKGRTMNMDWPVVAGTLSTGVFVTANLPMLVKAARTKDLASYSPGNLLLSNVGNVVYSFYVFSLPFGPAWGLHAFNVMVSLLMLTWWLRYRRRRTTRPVGTGVGPL
ncbi:hypothetical protein [Catenuloplanes japonicus]|uniref:hypothetical protein n=1 Tax=Catenuloplanes japonicus TaxID=33876 RepID=UPI000ADB289B|nr:hypothetical protein [Catenuloplanes japonicus]